MATHALVSVAVLLAVCAAPGALAQTVQVWSLCSPATYTAGSPYGARVRGVLRDVVVAAGSSRYGYATVVRSRREEEESLRSFLWKRKEKTKFISCYNWQQHRS